MSSKNRRVEFFEADIFDQDRANTILADDTIFFTLKDSQIMRFKDYMNFDALYKFDGQSEIAKKIETMILESVSVSNPIYFMSCAKLFRNTVESFSFVISRKEEDEQTFLFFSRIDSEDLKDNSYNLTARMYLKNNTLYNKNKNLVFTYYKPTCLTSNFLSFKFYNTNGKKKFIYETIDDYNSKKVKIEGYPGDTEELELASIYFENNRVSDYCFKLKDTFYPYRCLTKRIPWFNDYSHSDLRKINTKMSESEKGLIDMLLL